MCLLGDTKSTEELAIFIVCVVDYEKEMFSPISRRERGNLFAASMKLLRFALRASSASTTDKKLTEKEVALLQAI